MTYTCVNDACPNYGNPVGDPGTGYAPQCPVCHTLGGHPEPDPDPNAAAVHWGDIGGDLEDQEDIAEVVELAEEKAAQIVGITPGEVQVNATAAGTSTTATVTVPTGEHTPGVRLLMEPPQTPGLAVSRTRTETSGQVTYELTFTNTTTTPIQAQAIGYTLIG